MKRKRTVALALTLMALLAANVRTYTDTPDLTLDPQANVRTGLVVIVPSHDLCFGLEVEHSSTPDANGWLVRHVDTFGGPCE